MRRLFYISCIFTLQTSYAVMGQENLDSIQSKTITYPSDTVKVAKRSMFLGNDGPYIVGDALYRINTENKWIQTTLRRKDSLKVVVDNKDVDTFYVSLAPDYDIPESTFSLPEKVVVISDIEGNYNAFVSFLFSNNLIDENHNWIFGSGHLVLLGDFVDRGKNVTQVLWLIYKLEQQARLEDGHVHFILGNHEIMNFQGDARYNRAKYIKAAKKISKATQATEAIKYLYSTKTELGKWLATKNVMEKIGEYLFVHAGISPELLAYNLDVESINAIVRSKYYANWNVEQKDTVATFLYGRKGPFWYRGLITDRPHYKKIKEEDLSRLLAFYNVKKVVVGHTFVDAIRSDFGGKVIVTDVPHGLKKFSGKTEGLLIQEGKEFVIDDTGRKKLLKGNL